jgi:hypothetical protein
MEGRMPRPGGINWARPVAVSAIALAVGLAASCSKPGAAASSASAAPANVPATSAAVATTVPFVGCAFDGQVGPQPAPTGPARSVTLPPGADQQLAYYAGYGGIGVLAPRGWSCAGVYGSDGATLVVAPQPLTPADLMAVTWAGAAGDAVQVSQSSGDTSGRFEVAKVIARVFPAHQAFAQGVINEGVAQASDFPSGPYPSDKMTIKSNELIEYQTPAQASGLGTVSRLTAGADPISGAAILTGQTPDLVLLSARLPAGLSSLAPAIIEQLELDNPTGGAAQLQAAQPVNPQPAVGQATASPLAVVQDFYSALGAADGARASGDVVPEKRSGNYAAAALSRYYGSMSQPVQLISASAAGNTVAVRYTYAFANGRTCNGAANVSVTTRNGQPLIAGIQALNGC